MSTVEQWMTKKLAECQDDPEYLRAYIEILEDDPKYLRAYIKILVRELELCKSELSRPPGGEG